MFKPVFQKIQSKTHGAFGRKNISASPDVFVQAVPMDSAAHFLRRHSLLFRNCHVHCPENNMRVIYGSPNRYPIQRNAVKKELRLLQGRTGSPHHANFRPCQWIIGIIAELSRKVAGQAYTRLPLTEQEFPPLVGLFRHSKPCVLRHAPEPTAVHGRMDSPGIGIIPGEFQIPEIIKISKVLRGVEPLFGNFRTYCPFGRFFNSFPERTCFPFFSPILYLSQPSLIPHPYFFLFARYKLKTLTALSLSTFCLVSSLRGIPRSCCLHRPKPKALVPKSTLLRPLVSINCTTERSRYSGR